MAKDLLAAVPDELFLAADKVFGEPDSHEQGGIFVAVYKGKIKHRFLIDNDNSADQSPELIVFKYLIADVMTLLR